MDKVIRLKIKKELTSAQEKKIIQLKGALISGGYTDIIHFSEEGEEFYINSFTTLPERKTEALAFIAARVNDSSLSNVLEIQ